MSRAFQHEVFRFETANVIVSAVWSEDADYVYDGDDEDGETQAKLDNGEYVAFDTTVYVYHKGTGALLARDDLGGSVYAADEVETFFTAHRDPNPAHRNCSAMRAAAMAATGASVVLCHYFPDMVRQACREARTALRAMQATPVRAAA